MTIQTFSTDEAGNPGEHAEFELLRNRPIKVATGTRFYAGKVRSWAYRIGTKHNIDVSTFIDKDDILLIVPRGPRP